MTPSVVCTVGTKKFVLQDVGSLMNAEFQTLYQELYTSGSANWTRHDGALFQYLDSHTSVPDHDSYFNNLTIPWQEHLRTGQYAGAVELWHGRISAATRWESAHAPRKVHKGSPLYFLGVTHILAGNLDRGFLCMHRALDEDARTRGSSTPNTPAYAFVTIDSSKVDQLFRPWVGGLAMYVDSKLGDFRQSRGGTITFGDLRTRFLANPTLREEAFYLASLSAMVREYEKGPVRVEAESQFGSVAELRILFEICVVLERIIGSKSPSVIRKFIDRVAWLCSQAYGGPNVRIELGDINQKVFNNVPLGQLISDLIDLKYLFRGNRQPTRAEADLCLAYLVRNFGAHTLSAVPVVHDRFSELSSAILASVFVAVQTLLP